MYTIWLAFITGLTTGGVSCFAVQGGLLASAVSEKSNPGPTGALKEHASAVGTFLIAKFISYVVLGLILGAIGSTFILSPKLLGIVQIVAGLYMLATAARLANLHPIFRYTVISPPRWTYRLLKQTSVKPTVFAPFLLGFFTILMPCGITQAMMVYAIASGHALTGAGIMGAFVIGTSPVFFAMGAAIVGLLTNRWFTYVVAVLVAIMGLTSINGGLVLRGSLYTFQNFYKAAMTPIGASTAVNNLGAVNQNGEQVVNLTVTNHGYTSDVQTLKVGVPVRLKINSNNVTSCARAFVIPDFNISKVLPSDGVTELTFTPTKTGRLTYSCSMGMYTGEFQVE
jgi:sulfite exporter TauE/SafE